jgi:pyruvate,water dikinase
MNWCLSIHEIGPTEKPSVGGKAYALATLADAGFNIPDTLCIATHAYSEFIQRAGLKERILLELNRKDFKDMRWEEVWDASLRIRNMFIRTPLPDALDTSLRERLDKKFGNRPVVVRSSAPEEDDAATSFAGLHESYVNLFGMDAIIDAVRKVWASLWSDKALLYRQELGLSAETSTMGVVVQEIVVGDRSGIAFSKNPAAEYQGVVEAVYGLNEGLVDGRIEPDRWMFDRTSKKMTGKTPAQRDEYVVPGSQGVEVRRLPDGKTGQPPLSDVEAASVFDTVLRVEALFDAPQDMEWTIRNQEIFLLQCRPITTLSESHPDDQRQWDLSLHRSFASLKVLRQRIEHRFIPEMIEEADRLSRLELSDLSTDALISAIRDRVDINNRWTRVYWEEFIPFAHGIRLFGQIYNDAMRPENPYEFMDLLGSTAMASVERNRLLADMAEMIRTDTILRQQLASLEYDQLDQSFANKMERFVKKFGDLSCPVTGGTQCNIGSDAMIKVLLEMADHPMTGRSGSVGRDLDRLRSEFLNHFDGEERNQMADLLDLARASYRLRDDDNIHLGRIEAHMLAAVNEARQRLLADRNLSLDSEDLDEVIKALSDKDYRPVAQTTIRTHKEEVTLDTLQARQLTGQPAGPGISKGLARVVQEASDLSEFKSGEVLVCDAVDPNMTFVVPLATGVVERRGGMLIHGAIIAREYGLPCVTGVADATILIKTGDQLTIDGYLGIVTVGQTGSTEIS